MKLGISFKWYDLWIGAYYDRINRVLYVCPLPTIAIVVKR